MLKLPLFASLLHVLPITTLALDNGLARVPPMGWNSWNKFFCDINQTVIKQAANKVVELGLKDAGYTYVNIDDCWMSKNRTLDGTYQADPYKFPDGMKAVGDYIHAKGLKYGIYTSAGTMTCQRLPASLGREDQDAATFASWGVDYLKYDNCYNQGISSLERYPKMRDALAKTGRPILYSLCQWGAENTCNWAGQVGNVWRTTGDIEPEWDSIKRNFLQSQACAPHTGPGAWADPDMLELGNGHLTLEEQKSHFAMWAMAKAPLILGMDLDTVTSETLTIVTNENLIAINQDVNSKQALCYIGCSDRNATYSIYATTVTGGDVVAMVIHWADKPGNEPIVFQAQEIGVIPASSETVKVTDLWTNEEVGIYTFGNLLKFQVPPLPAHGSTIYRFSIINDEFIGETASTSEHA